jgi:prepilin-type N-terminal cleavage/methylation domain-containing protein
MKKMDLGFTLVELMVVVSVIGILSSIVYANFGSARGAARDDIRKSSLEEVQVGTRILQGAVWSLS